MQRQVYLNVASSNVKFNKAAENVIAEKICYQRHLKNTPWFHQTPADQTQAKLVKLINHLSKLISAGR